MKTTVSSKGQIVLPAALRQQDQIRSGEQFEVSRLEKGKYLFTKVPPRRKSGVLDWLLACPSKDWFQPLESESTENL
jgi:AbrB family looped-hinge helix DNA binding protein